MADCLAGYWVVIEAAELVVLLVGLKEVWKVVHLVWHLAV